MPVQSQRLANGFAGVRRGLSESRGPENHLNRARTWRSSANERAVNSRSAGLAGGRLLEPQGHAPTVDLPEPLSPTSPTVSPGASSNETPSAARQHARRGDRCGSTVVLGRARSTVEHRRARRSRWSRRSSASRPRPAHRRDGRQAGGDPRTAPSVGDGSRRRSPGATAQRGWKGQPGGALSGRRR